METKESLREEDEMGIKGAKERHEYISKLFERASILDEKNMGYMTPTEWKELKLKSGVENFKMNVFGDSLYSRLFKRKTVKLPSELADIFYKIHIVGSKEEGEKLVSMICGQTLIYADWDKIEFIEVENAYGKKAVRIKKSVINSDY